MTAYLTPIVIEKMGQVFSSARDIMKWLADCARVSVCVRACVRVRVCQEWTSCQEWTFCHRHHRGKGGGEGRWHSLSGVEHEPEGRRQVIWSEHTAWCVLPIQHHGCQDRRWCVDLHHCAPTPQAHG